MPINCYRVVVCDILVAVNRTRITCLASHFRQSVLANMRGAREPVFFDSIGTVIMKELYEELCWEGEV